MNAEQFQELVRQVSELTAKRKSNPWLGPTFLLSVVMIVVGGIFGYAKQEENSTNLNSRVTALENANNEQRETQYSQKDATKDYNVLSDRITALGNQTQRLEQKIDQLQGTVSSGVRR